MKNIRNTLLLFLFLYHLPAAAQFKFENTGTGQTLWDLHYAPGGNLYAAGNNGFLMRSNPLCGTWESLNTGVGNGLRKVRFVSSQVGFACGTSGTLVRTLNGGDTWQSMNTGTSIGLLAMEFINDSTGFIAGGGSGGNLILKTTDTGNSWTIVENNLPWAAFDMHFVNQDTGYVSGVLGVIYKTTDGGDNWFSLNHPTGPGNPVWTGIYFTSADTGYVAGQNGSISKTTDGGITWTPQTTPGTDYLNTVYFTNRNTGYAAGNSGAIYQTVDGQNWSAVNTSFSTALRAAVEVNNQIYMAGSAGLVLSYFPDLSYDILFEETFCDTASIDSLRNWNNAGSQKWRFDNPGNRTSTDSLLEAPYAIVDSEHFGNTQPDSAVLETDLIDVSGLDTLSLVWNEFFRPDSSGLSTCRIEVLDGTTTHTVYENSGGFEGSDHEDYIHEIEGVPQTAQLPFNLTQNQIKLRFTYINTSAAKHGWWAVDNLKITDGFKDIAVGNTGSGQNYCDTSDSINITVTVENSGNFDVPGVEIIYGFSGGTKFYRYYKDSIPANTTRSFTVSADTVLPQNTSTSFEVEIYRAFDGDNTNDAGQYNITSFSPTAAAGNDTVICAGSSITLEGQSTLYDSVFWQVNQNAKISGNQITADSAGSYVYTAYLAGCADQDTLHLTVREAAPLSVPGDTQICGNEKLNLSLNMSQFDSIQRFPSPFSGDAISTIRDSGIYIFTTFENNCSRTDTVSVSQVTEEVGLPEFIRICSGTDTLVTPQNQYGDHYLWLHDQSTNPEIRIDEEDTYILRMSKKGCAFYDTLEVEVVNTPLGTVAIQPHEPRAGEIVNFEMHTDADEIYWNFGSSSNPQTASGQGPHSVTFNSAGGTTVSWNLESEVCGVFEFDTVFTVQGALSVFENPTNEKVQLYPNPASNRVIVKTVQPGAAEIYNLSGTRIREYRLLSGENDLNIDRIPAGIYPIKIRTSNNEKIIKLIIR